METKPNQPIEIPPDHQITREELENAFLQRQVDAKKLLQKVAKGLAIIRGNGKTKYSQEELEILNVLLESSISTGISEMDAQRIARYRLKCRKELKPAQEIL